MESPSSSGEETGGLVEPSLKIEGYTVRLEGSQVPLYSGSVDYWQIDRGRWRGILEQVRALGFRIISVCVPWNVHEVARELYDFGTTDDRRDLDAFLNLCSELGLYVIIRPGPNVNAGLTYFGYPARIIFNSSLQAQSAAGTSVIIPALPSPFPMPSYANEHFYDEVSKYFDVVCPIFRRNLIPGGSIIGVQIDNNIPLLFMHGPFSADYSPSAIRWYYDFLSGKYSSIGVLNRAYRTRYTKFTEVEPVRALATTEKEALPRYLDWVEFQEYYVGLALSVLASLLWARGIRGTFTSHNVQDVYPQLPTNAARAERELDIQGVGLYQGYATYDRIRRGSLYLSTVSRLPYLAESAIGTSVGGPSLSFPDQQYALLVALMYGFRGFNIHMLVERNRWLGSPISHLGHRDDRRYAFIKRLLTILTNLDFPKLQRNIPTLLLRNFEYERLLALGNYSNWLTNFLGIPSELLMSDRTFSYSNTIQRAYPAFWEALYWGLTRAKIPFQIGDTDQDLPALSRYRILFLPTFDYMSEDLQQKMLDYVNGGGTAVIGPEIPYLDADMRGFTKLSDASNLRPMSTRPPIVGLHDSLRIENKEVLLGSRKAGRIVSYGDGNFIYMGVTFAPVTSRYDATEAEDVISKIAQSLEVQPVGDLRAPDVDEVYWGDRAPRLIFLANSSNQPQSVGVQIAQRAQLRDGWTGEKLVTRGPQEIALQPYGIRILEVIR